MRPQAENNNGSSVFLRSFEKKVHETSPLFAPGCFAPLRCRRSASPGWVRAAKGHDVDPRQLASRSRNTPFAGRTLSGRVRHTFLRGEPIVVGGEARR